MLHNTFNLLELWFHGKYTRIGETGKERNYAVIQVYR